MIVQSSEIAGAAYFSPWYMCSVRCRRALLVVMVRTRRFARLTAAGFTTLSLASFMAVSSIFYYRHCTVVEETSRFPSANFRKRQV